MYFLKLFVIRNNLILMNQQKHQFDCNEKIALAACSFCLCQNNILK